MHLLSTQGAGKFRINMSADGIDALAFTGHKDLMALPGVGGLVSLEQLIITPLVQGGLVLETFRYHNTLLIYLILLFLEFLQTNPTLAYWP